MKWLTWMPSLALGLALAMAPAAGAETVCVAVEKAELTRSPTAPRSPVVLVVPRNYPLEVENSTGRHWQVRDFRGRRGWIRGDLVAARPGVVVAAAVANVRRGPGLDHPVVFRAKEGVAFRVLSRQADWLHVRHEGGRDGWIHRNLTWGRYP